MIMKIGRVKIAASFALLLISLIGMVACAPAAAPTSAPAPVVPTAAPTNPPATALPPTSAPAQSSSVTIALASNAQLGKVLADGNGRTLYLFTKDTPGTSNCYDKCEQSWPPLVSSAKPVVKDGISDALIGTTQRKDGTSQITYNGWPLYFFGKDQNPGDTAGQSVGKVWWVISGEGNPVKPSGVGIGTNAKLGKFLEDDAGRTVYAFTKDTKDTTVCYDKCEQAWPPLLSLGQPTTADEVDAKMIGLIQRKDGTMQVTYNSIPLYYYAKDQAPGDTNGQGVGQVWYVVTPEGGLDKQS